MLIELNFFAMKKYFFSVTRYNHSVDLMILLLRLVAGSFMITHGWGKAVNVFDGPPFEFGDPIRLGETASLFLVAFAEFFCAIFVILGFAARLSAIPVIITMLVAAFVAHWEDAFFAKELPLMFTTMYFVIAVLGPGRYSLDYAFSSRRK